MKLNAQDTLYTKVLITNKITNDEAITISQYFNRDGVIVSRMDPTTNEFLCIFTTKSMISEEFIDDWFSVNYNIKCLFSENYRPGKIINLKQVCH